ncbi:hypothetical protein OJM17_gp050 [uncultured phage cr23_1]|uniref:hypothetical protein n=1 Tax=uncultured phage cr23_1 TaxID=2986419 RepID=UPI001C750B1F|nr:hypothetical protein OJM17_gp050 [uncultured phage cr23_1]
MITKGIRISQLVERKDLNGKEIIPFQDGIHNGKLSILSLIDYIGDISDSDVELQALIKILKFVDTVSEMDLLLYQAKEGDIYYCKENKKLYVRSFNKWDMLDPLTSKVYVLVGLDEYNRTNIIHLWDGNDMVVMSERLFIGEVTGTAYDGGKGKHLADIANSLPDNVIREVADFTTDGSTVTFNYEYDVKQESGLFDGDAQGSKTIPSATTSNAGVMSATDKVKVDKIVTDGDGNKYLTDNGNYQELIEDTTETIKTTDAIPVAGGPLADLLNKAGINSISPDTSMLDLFVSLFTKELWPTNLVFKEGTVSAAIAAPSFTLSNTGLVEVGATVTIGKTILSAATMSTTARTYSGFTYGYSSTNDNTKDSSNTTITVNASNAALNSVNYTMKRTTNGSVENATANTNPALVTLDSKTFKAIEGTNTVKVDITGPTANATFASMPVYYACSNLGKTSEEHKSVAKDTITKTSSTPSNSKTLNVTGVYPYYTNKDNITTFAKLGLTTNKTLDVTFVAETASNKHAFKIPAKFNVTKITLLNTLSGKYEDYSVSRFSVTTENIDVQGANVQYKVYTRNDGTNGSSSFKITFA